MLSNYAQYNILETTGLIIIKFLLLLVELGFYVSALFLAVLSIISVFKIPGVFYKLFVFIVLGLAAFACLSLGYTIGLTNIEFIFKI
ncbi:hypothetical protein F379_196 [Campylobacter phage F379]|nr:hypothetical protein [Campylobacter jejuni]QOI69482.1 hypothetical protein F379_196 [Campylobacter phage F379]QXO06111.1 hypothetical protein [Campylobacter phage CJLB-12]QXO06337.1 hypothetical protein [Campylobacter phage CJLB-14]RTH89712.1 hypothetical protein C3I33_08190 [Campylobacter jejuni]RTH92100.1 hypothetical protein C3I35_08695 [Campylobacter jejuni]